MFRETSLLLNAESIIEGGHQQDLLHLVAHQVVEDIPVGILLAQKFLKQHPGIHLPGMLKLADLLPHGILLLGLVKNFPGFLAVQVIGDDAGQVLDQLTLLLQERAFVQLGKLLQVEDLDLSLPVVDGLKLLGLFPVPFPKSLAV